MKYTSKNGMILINITIFMSIIIAMLMSSYAMNKNVVNSSAKAIQNKGIQIYNNSKVSLIDFKLLHIFKNELTDTSNILSTPNTKLPSISLFQNSIFNFTTTNFNHAHNFPNDMLVIIDEVKLTNYNKNIYLTLHFDYKIDNKTQRRTITYMIDIPSLTLEDIQDLKLKKIDKVYDKYKDTFISNKIIS